MIRRLIAWFRARRIVRELDADWSEWYELEHEEED